MLAAEHPTGLSPIDWLQHVLVMVVLFAYFGLLAGIYFATGFGPSGPSYGLMFGLVWVVLPPVTLLAGLALHTLKRRALDDHPLFNPLVLICGCVPPLLISPLLLTSSHEYTLLTEVLALPVFGASATLGVLVFAYVLAFPISVATIVLSLKRKGADWRMGTAVTRIANLAYVLTPLSISIALIHFAPRVPSLNWPTLTPTSSEERLVTFGMSLVLAAGLTGAALAGSTLARHPFGSRIVLLLGSRAARAIFTAIVLACVAVVAFDIALPTDLFHQFSFLAPIHAIQLGRTPLVDVSSGNGVLVVFFFSWLFQLFDVPHTARGLTLVNTFLIIGEFFALFFLLRYLTRSTVWAALGVAAIIWFHLLSAAMQINWYTQHGPSRFGLPYVYLLLVAMRGAHPRAWRVLFGLEHLVFGVASIWMLEAFLYVVVAYQAVTWYEAYAQAATPGKFVTFLLRRAGLSIVAVAVAHVGLTLLVYVRSGQLPDWPQYLVVFGTLAPDQDSLWSGRQIPLWTPWALLLVTHMVSLLVVVARVLMFGRTATSRSEKVVFGMTATGILQFYYTILLAFPYSLHPVVIPAVFVAFYWASRLWDARLVLPRTVWVPALFAFSWGVLAAGLATAPVALERLGQARPLDDSRLVVSMLVGRIGERVGWNSGWTAAQFGEYVVGEPATSDAAAALALIEAHRPPGEDRLAVFLYDGVVTSEVLMRAGALHAYPMDYPTQDALHEVWRNRSLQTATPLHEGDVIYVDPSSTNWLMRRVVRGLCEQFDLEVLDSKDVAVKSPPSGSLDPHTIWALRLSPSAEQTFSPWCVPRYAPFVADEDGAIFAVETEKRRRIPDSMTLDLLAGAGIKPDSDHIVRLSNQDVASIPEGDPLDSASDGPLFVRIAAQVYLLSGERGLLHMATQTAVAEYGGEDDNSNILTVTDGDERFWLRPPYQLQGEVRLDRVKPSSAFDGSGFGLDAILLPNVPSIR